MRVALIDTDRPGYEYSLAPIAKILLAAGHEVMAVYSGSQPPSDPRVRFGSCSWALFDHSPLLDFNPDRIVIFNGFHNGIYAAARFFESRWKVIYMEHGWLPQRHHNYIDHMGTGARSSLLKDWRHLIGSAGRMAETLSHLEKTYEPGKVALELPERYILIPMQLERDTSIVFDSPWFKSMPSLVGFVRRNFPEFPIIIKLHPMDKSTFNFTCFKNVTVAPAEIPINDLVPGAEMVIGINSTSLIEALVHKKKVGALGLNVASEKGVFYEGDAMRKDPRGILKFQLDPGARAEVLDALHHAQYPRANPPRWVMEKIIEG